MEIKRGSKLLLQRAGGEWLAELSLSIGTNGYADESIVMTLRTPHRPDKSIADIEAAVIRHAIRILSAHVPES